MSCRDQPCRFRYNARNLRHSSPSAGSKSGISIPLFYAARRVTSFAQRSVTEGALKMMLLTKLKVVALVLTTGLLATGAGVLTYGGPPQQPGTTQVEKPSEP